MSAWYGIRPLCGDPNAKDQSSASRDHVVAWLKQFQVEDFLGFCAPHFSSLECCYMSCWPAQVSHHPTNGITFVSGGKWTTWREMAEDGVEQVIQGHPELKKKALGCREQTRLFFFLPCKTVRRTW